MDRISELLERYFRAETTLAEENELKTYFNSGTVTEKHEAYRTLFTCLTQEKKRNYPGSLPDFKATGTRSIRLRIRSTIWIAVAASVAAVLFLQIPVTEQKHSSYAIIMGKRIDDPRYAQDYAEKKLENIQQKIENSLAPLKTVDKVNNSLKPLQNLQRIPE